MLFELHNYVISPVYGFDDRFIDFLYHLESKIVSFLPVWSRVEFFLYHFALGSQYECGFAGLTGVPSYSQYERLLQELSELGVQRLNIMIDSDYQDNDKVRTARDRYIELGAEAGFEVARITWSRRQKGIDDLYKHLFRSKWFDKAVAHEHYSLVVRSDWEWYQESSKNAQM